MRAPFAALDLTYESAKGRFQPARGPSLSVYPPVGDNDGDSNDARPKHIYGASIYNRCDQRKGHRLTGESQGMENGGGATATGTESLSVKDNRTGKGYDVDVEDGTVRAMDFREVKVDEEDFGLMTYDPGYSNTASCRSAVTYIDG